MATAPKTVEGSQIVIEVKEPSKGSFEKSADKAIDSLMFNVGNEKMRSPYLKSFFSTHGLKPEVKLTPLRRGVRGSPELGPMPTFPLNVGEEHKYQGPAPTPPPVAVAQAVGMSDKLKDGRVRPPNYIKQRVEASGDADLVGQDGEVHYRLAYHDTKAETGEDPSLDPGHPNSANRGMKCNGNGCTFSKEEIPPKNLESGAADFSHGSVQGQGDLPQQVYGDGAMEMNANNYNIEDIKEDLTKDPCKEGAPVVKGVCGATKEVVDKTVVEPIKKAKDAIKK